VKVVVVADTHLGPGGRGRLPPALYRALGQAGAVLHAGDVLVEDVLDDLAGYAPVSAVLGNNDVELAGRLPETRIVEIDGVRIGLVHDSGRGKTRAARMARRFPDCAVVVFGHTHVALDEAGLGGQRLFNPGSPTRRRTRDPHSFGVLDCAAGRLRSARIVEV
jgi:putative phosphoesterase